MPKDPKASEASEAAESTIPQPIAQMERVRPKSTSLQSAPWRQHLGRPGPWKADRVGPGTTHTRPVPPPTCA